MLTQRSRYGLRAMLMLAREARGGPPLPGRTRGKQGGFHLARPAHLISFGDIIRVIEGPLALVPCVSRTAYKKCKDCKDEATCEIRLAMMTVRDDTARILDGTSLAAAVSEELAAA
jgi:DNA-binding IscR family transcriptional regulator